MKVVFPPAWWVSFSTFDDDDDANNIDEQTMYKHRSQVSFLKLKNIICFGSQASPYKFYNSLNRQWHQLKFNTCVKSWIDDADGGDRGNDDDDGGGDGNHGDDEDEVKRLSCSEQICPVS